VKAGMNPWEIPPNGANGQPAARSAGATGRSVR
jgi:hypothetical protein